MKRFLALVCLFLLLLVNRRHRQGDPEALAGAEGTKDPRTPMPKRSRVPQTPGLAVADDARLPEGAQPILQQALRTFALAELEKRKASNDFLAKSLVSGLQRKMFLDDYHYAALASGADGSRAPLVYSNMLAQASALSDADLERQASDSPAIPDDEGTGQRMQQFYSLALSSQNPGYSNVLEAIKPLTAASGAVGAANDPTKSDLLKDAWSYVSARSEDAKVIAAEDAENEDSRRWLIEGNKDPVARSNALVRFEATRSRPDEAFRPSQEALERLFAERFRQHGLDPVEVTRALGGLSLTNVAMEVWIP